jgi:hypothetical protein
VGPDDLRRILGLKKRKDQCAQVALAFDNVVGPGNSDFTRVGSDLRSPTMPSAAR